jgi:hypothetical protein
VAGDGLGRRYLLAANVDRAAEIDLGSATFRCPTARSPAGVDAGEYASKIST